MARAVEVDLGVSGPSEIDLVSDDANELAIRRIRKWATVPAGRFRVVRPV